MLDRNPAQESSSPMAPDYMKIIFLDFDGVLCNRESISLGYKQRQSPKDDPYGPHPECVTALNHILKTTNACIVVSSTWRRGCSIADTRGRLKRWGVEGEVIGVTPVLGMAMREANPYRTRGMEIKQWLERYSRHPVESFVILDDDSDMGDLIGRLIRTDFVTGLTLADADRAIALLS